MHPKRHERRVLSDGFAAVSVEMQHWKDAAAALLSTCDSENVLVKSGVSWTFNMCRNM